ncbi:MAG: molybdenum cofactor biosynthesis protein MoaB [Deltaproteobacteria bacterium]|nr:molybdenum cofactor biosynthesis protein MoaB [Deltaproteobacteria bacterium]MBW1958934.1 molybdenum cofactor biosynthesis protein MoaB [Deltaproteobacteria bacterium]MBW2014841.1 molybdenum cofactor biosynthesis protein MoaB [Deltaproteobacteria bacterium]MBW2090393.1 molybdenum cofactor biosynthesis protein MoaB [Deltaproteobacteria bacterium]MBW2321553.1 molybdenum cofactor biosynthesis protein MoaB [Deltaproteobacteria bacterium]
MGSKKHKANAPKNLNVGIITVSSTRSMKEDKSGQWISKRVKKEGHNLVLHRVVPDVAETITQTVHETIRDYGAQVLLVTGGTGISNKDVTIEAVRPFFTKELTAFGPLFAQLSFEQIDSAALLSRATAGVIEKTIVFCMPGSLKACKLACKALIFPELGHLVKHIHEN